MSPADATLNTAWLSRRVSTCVVTLQGFLSGMHTLGNMHVTLSAQQEGDLSEGWRQSEALQASGSGHLAVANLSGSPLELHPSHQAGHVLGAQSLFVELICLINV